MSQSYSKFMFTSNVTKNKSVKWLLCSHLWWHSQWTSIVNTIPDLFLPYLPGQAMCSFCIRMLLISQCMFLIDYSCKLGSSPHQYQIHLSYNVPDEIYQEDIVILELNQSSNPRLIVELKPVMLKELGKILIKDVGKLSCMRIRKCKLDKLVVCLSDGTVWQVFLCRPKEEIRNCNHSIFLLPNGTRSIFT